MNIKQQMKWRSLGFVFGSCVGFILIIPKGWSMDIRLAATLVTGLAVAFADLARFSSGLGSKRKAGLGNDFRNEQDND